MTSDDAPPDAVPQTYSDGHPLDQVHYREYKLILRPARFGSPRSFAEFSRMVRHAAEQLDVALFREEHGNNQIREVLFFDTPAFDLYNNAFILRRRTTYQNGWPLDDHELVLKFRHPDVDTAARVDMRPAGAARYEIKFKEELLPARDGLGGVRSLYSHNCTLDTPPPLRDRPFEDVVTVFPALRHLGVPPGSALQLVNGLATEEVLADLGELHFGHGLKAKANIAVWRDRGPQTPLVGEFAFQCKFERFTELHQKARQRADEFFRALQAAAPEWTQLNATKTGVIYGTGRTPVTNRE
jgi:hypothetical protein